MLELSTKENLIQNIAKEFGEVAFVEKEGEYYMTKKPYKYKSLAAEHYRSMMYMRIADLVELWYNVKKLKKNETNS